ncbi:hypothetical protein C4544_05715 [candidate division WS5 bacterium]|uniref:DUF5659 domain-containing protein n=1 Tax=candidate division WS5 bacterium TaxID=2093353 RepID=A0A419DAZ1_9BACT|nr:MAG: hypothetical protein C4544_05715 [candidate division WS5 bacterium]
MINTQDYFETSDFPLAITLICQGFVIENFDTVEPRKIKFLFAETEVLLKTVNNYWNNKISVNPKVFFNAQKELKSRMFELQRKY